jgi:hypothetical protein
MATVGDIVTLALKDAQIIDENETPSAALMADAITTLSQMLALWQADNLFVYATTELTHAPTGAASYTIGPTGVIVSTATPLTINYVYLLRDSVAYEMLEKVMTLKEFTQIANTSITGDPNLFFYNPTYSNGTLYIHPMPNSGTLHIGVDVVLPSYSIAPDAFSIAPRYEMPVRFNLAKILGAMLGNGVSKSIEELAKSSYRMLARSNQITPKLSIDGEVTRTWKTEFYGGFVN